MTRCSRGRLSGFLISNTQTLDSRNKDAIDRVHAGLPRETVDWMYSESRRAEDLTLSSPPSREARAKRIRDEFFPKSSVSSDEIISLDLIVPDAVNLKFTTAPLTKEQLRGLDQDPTPKVSGFRSP